MQRLFCSWHVADSLSTVHGSGVVEVTRSSDPGWRCRACATAETALIRPPSAALMVVEPYPSAGPVDEQHHGHHVAAR